MLSPVQTPVQRAVSALLTPATLIVRANPLPETEPEIRCAIPAGSAIASHLPHALANECVVCRYNGVWILRAEWQRPVAPGDVVEFHVRAQGGDSDVLRTVLTLVVIVAAAYYGAPLGQALAPGATAATQAAIGTGVITLAGTLAINALLPAAQAPGANGPGSSPTYNVSLSGNTARVDGAIPVLYGYNRTFPDFGAQPYTEFDNETDDQYYYAYLSLGFGEFGSLRVEIDDTPLDHFDDVQYAVLGPGDLPTLVETNVVSAPEVTGQEIVSGRFSPGFAACGQGKRAEEIGVDVVLAGLGEAEADGDFDDKSVQVRFDWREVDDFGVPVTAWVSFGTETITASTSSAVRRSFRYALPGAARVEVRCVRVDVKSNRQGVLNTPQWSGLRAYLDESGTGDLATTRVELRIRATEQLNGLSQRRISVAGVRKLHTWSPLTGWSAEPVETRNPAWALADKWRSTAYGDSQPDSRIDLNSLHQLSQVWDARQDRLDIVFDTFTDSNSADQAIANAGRAYVIRRNGVRTVVRDQAAEVPVTAFTSRSIRPGSLSLAYALADSRTPDGVIVEYFSNRVWDWLPIECPAPGVTTITRPVRTRLLGVTGAKHAEREGRFMAGKLAYRRKTASFSTELQGVLPAYGSAVVVAPALPGWGQSGDVAFWDAGSLVMGLSEPPVFGAGTHYISLVRDDGSLTQPIVATPAADAWSVTLATAPDFELVLDQADRERPKFVFGAEGEHRTVMRMLSIEPAGVDGEGTPQIDLTAVAEDDRLHTLDNALLPAPGEVQDPIVSDSEPVESGGGGGGGGGGEQLLIVDMASGEFQVFAQANSGVVGSSPPALARFQPNGRIVRDPVGIYPSSEQWLRFSPVEPTAGAGYEVRVRKIRQLPSSAPEILIGPQNTWLSLSTNREWSIEFNEGDPSFGSTDISLRLVEFYADIRDATTQVIQDTRQFQLQCSDNPISGG